MKSPNNREEYFFKGISSQYWVIWMLKNFITALGMAKEQINDTAFMITNRRKSTYFTKDTVKMNFKDAIYFILK